MVVAPSFFLERGVSLCLPKIGSAGRFSVTSDASGSVGLGIVFGSAWVAERWPPLPSDTHISVLELIPIVIAAHIWGHRWSRKSVLFHCDNTAVVHCLQAGLCKHPHLSFLLRELATLAVTHSFRFSAKHVPGVYNKVTDALSRFRFQVFKSLRPWADAERTPVPQGLISRLLKSG